MNSSSQNQLKDSNSGKLESLKAEPVAYPGTSENMNNQMGNAEMQLSNPFYETLTQVWKRYIRLYESNSKYLFEDNNKSKEKFCELLHSQIDVSNKLFMMLSQTDDKKFLEYSREMNKSLQLLPSQSTPFPDGESPLYHTHPLSTGLTLPFQPRRICNPVVLSQPENEQDEIKSPEMIAFLKAQEEPQPTHTQTSYSTIRQYLFNDNVSDLQEGHTKGSLNYSLLQGEKKDTFGPNQSIFNTAAIDTTSYRQLKPNLAVPEPKPSLNNSFNSEKKGVDDQTVLEQTRTIRGGKPRRR